MLSWYNPRHFNSSTRFFIFKIICANVVNVNIKIKKQCQYQYQKAISMAMTTSKSNVNSKKQFQYQYQATKKLCTFATLNL
jgi:hypothetical protein